MSMLILPAAVILDLIAGDPEYLPHPIRWMGRAITFFEPRFRRLPFGTGVNGLFFALFLIGITLTASAFVIGTAYALHPMLGTAVQIVFLYYCISVKSLGDAAMGVYGALTTDGLDAAREKLKWIVGREVDRLDETGVSRAAVETVAENLVDGVISPIFFGAFFGVPFALAYKMINTMDSMVGYQNDTYREFGKAAAKIDDAANYLPARLCVPVIALMARMLFNTGGVAFRTALKDGRKHKSPNSGFSESAFAGALHVRLGGPNRYHGRMVDKPYIGDGNADTLPHHIPEACRLMVAAALFWSGTMWIIVLL